MERYVGVNVSLETSSVCVMDRTGRILREAKVATEPEALASFCAAIDGPVTLLGMEAGPLSQWLHAGLVEAGYRRADGDAPSEVGAFRPCP